VFYYSPATLAQVASPWFKVLRVRPEGQYCTLDFLAERVKTLSPVVGELLLKGMPKAARRLPLYVNSGSMTVILEKTSN
jgi:hypothetical protein